MKKIFALVVLAGFGLALIGCSDPQEKKNLERFERGMQKQREGMANPQQNVGAGTPPATK